jgi:valyl-tRNA synthetase
LEALGFGENLEGPDMLRREVLRFEMGLVQDPDVLDTWFSSALWPHSTLGWPEQTPELAYYYPTSVLVTSRGIITLWVARMVITGLYNVGKIPFHHVYIHPTILDGFGETMSKSKGNGIDPVDIIERYGTDALRFGMAYLATETQDSRMPVSNVCPHCQTLVPLKQEHMYMRTRKVICPSCKKPFRPGGPWPAPDPELPTAKQASDRFELGRNFANKIWNAARFLLMNLDGYRPEAIRIEELPIEDRWILSRLATTTAAVTEQLEGYHFSEAARTIYDFTWSEFCDWYVEMSKGRLRAGVSGPEGTSERETQSGRLAQRVLVGVLDGILRLVQPIMPYVAESLWQALNEAAFERGLPGPEPAAPSVVIAPWPSYPAAWPDADMERRMARMQELIRSIREIRNRYQVEPKTAVDAFVRCSPEAAGDFRTLEPFIIQLANVGKLKSGPDVTKPSQSAGHVNPEFEVYVSLRGLIDAPSEIKRLEKQLADKRKHLQSIQAKLGNAGYLSKAPAEVVQQTREQAADLEKQIQTLEGNLQELRQQ